jgi:hypothetical protein
MLNVENFLMCPLTKEVMRDPVILVESGHTYERRAIQVCSSLRLILCR